MNIDRLAEELIAEEGLRLEPYRCTEGFLTTGVGRNLDTNPLSADERAAIGHDGRSKPITRAQALYLLDNDIMRVLRNLDIYLPWWDELDEVRQHVLIGLCFQIGHGGLLKFKKMLADLQAKDFNGAAFELMDSKYSLQTPARAARYANRLKSGVA